MVTPTEMPAATSPVNPFDSELAVRHSQYFYTKDGLPVSRGGPAAPPDLFASAAVAAFRGFVQNPQFSCVGAKSAVAQESARLGVYDHLGSAEATAGLARDLWTFTHEPDTHSDNDYVTFVALFKGPTELDEAGFEDHLWEQLRQLNRLDAPLHAWDPTVSADPDDPHFGFSFAGTAFFVVGLHPHSSREARRFPWPLLVLNPHAQFTRLRVTDPLGEQLADLTAFAAADPKEWLSSGRSIDYANTIYLTAGHVLYSNRSRPMLMVESDTVGRHEFLLTPCSPETFQILYQHQGHHPSCFSNLVGGLAPFGIPPDAIPTTFNIFMNVVVAADGTLSIGTPRSKAGDSIVLRAEMDLVVGLTACSAEKSNNYSFKPIDYEVLSPA